MSLDVVMKHLCAYSCQYTQSRKICHNELGIRRPHYTENLVIVACIRPVQIERRKLADKVVRCLPDLNMRFVGDGDERSIGRKLDRID
jgi:hypothetical protein